MAENPRRRAQRRVAQARRAGNLGDLTGLKGTVNKATTRRQDAERARAADIPAPAAPQPRVPVRYSARDFERERASVARRWSPENQGGDQNVMPKSYNDEYPPYDTFPKYNYSRERAEAKRFGRFIPPESNDSDFIPLTYDPTKTSWPANGWDHRRTIAAGYDASRGILRVKFFTDGAVYDYGVSEPVPRGVAYNFRLTQSPGRFINSTLEAYGYQKVA